jgi:hypothetical protein
VTAGERVPNGEGAGSEARLSRGRPPPPFGLAVEEADEEDEGRALDSRGEVLAEAEGKREAAAGESERWRERPLPLARSGESSPREPTPAETSQSWMASASE